MQCYFCNVETDVCGCVLEAYDEEALERLPEDDEDFEE